MTNEIIFRKAVKKANKKGFPIKEETLNWDHFRRKPERQAMFARSLLFSHPFAKAFFGDKPKPYRQYQYHLEKMVLYKNPIEYIKKFI